MSSNRQQRLLPLAPDIVELMKDFNGIDVIGSTTSMICQEPTTIEAPQAIESPSDECLGRCLLEVSVQRVGRTTRIGENYLTIDAIQDINKRVNNLENRLDGLNELIQRNAAKLCQVNDPELKKHIEDNKLQETFLNTKEQLNASAPTAPFGEPESEIKLVKTEKVTSLTKSDLESSENLLLEGKESEKFAEEPRISKASLRRERCRKLYYDMRLHYVNLHVFKRSSTSMALNNRLPYKTVVYPLRKPSKTNPHEILKSGKVAAFMDLDSSDAEI